MRLFLSSEGFGNYPQVLLKLLRGGRRTAFIDNAKDGLRRAERTAHVEEKLVEFASYRLHAEEIDLRKFFDKPDRLADRLAAFDLVWVSGGNPFILRRAMKYSGFDKLIIKMLKEDKLAYGGSSAGAIMPTPSLHGTQYGEDPKSLPKVYGKYGEKVVWGGLNLVDFHIVPHYKSDWFGQEADRMVEYMKKHGLKYHALKNGQVIVVNGDKTEFLK